MGILDALKQTAVSRLGGVMVTSGTPVSMAEPAAAMPSAAPTAVTVMPAGDGPQPANDFGAFLDKTITDGPPSMQYHALYLKERMLAESQNKSLVNSEILALAIAGQGGGRTATAVGGLVGINDYGVKGRRQYAAERRRLMDLYVIVLNNGDIRTATMHLRNEIFRRGIEWEPAFEYKCDACNEEYSAAKARKMKFRCNCINGVPQEEPTEEEDEQKGAQQPGQPAPSKPKGPKLRKPDKRQIDRIKDFMEKANYFGQSVEAILRMCEDDINTVDDGFIYFRKSYEITEQNYYAALEDPFNDKYAPDMEVMQVFRLDPTLVEFDLDARGVPGMLHHICVFHRDVLLNVPIDEGWDLQWQGRCNVCGLRTYPVYFKYAEQQSGSFGARKPDVLYLLEDEVIHWSRYSPTETYGFPPILSIYEKALTLIGMDRYLYDYFYERRVPQGMIAVTTDDPVGMEATRADVEAKMQRDPHYIPWVTVASKTGQGRMEFVRFAYSLDELDYLPVRDEIRERISGLFGVSNIWMQDTESSGGINNESQQLTVMSRVVEGAQRSYHTDVMPKFERAFKITDWFLRIQTPEETNEMAELQIFQIKVGIAGQMAGMGFGVEYDSEEKEFTYTGRVPSKEEQEQTQRDASNPFSNGGYGGDDDNGPGGGGAGGGNPFGGQAGAGQQPPQFGNGNAGSAGGSRGGSGTATAVKPIAPPKRQQPQTSAPRSPR